MSVSSTSSLIAALNGTSGSSASSSSSSASGTSSSVSDMQTTFLKLLTTQLQNQDPTNPMDNTQMTSQLAQMASAQGITTLNSTLNNLLSLYQSSQAMQASSLIGHNILADGNQIALSGSRGLGGVTLGGAADTVTVKIADSAGNAVRTINLGAHSAGQVGFSWDGTNDQGQTVPDGSYTMTVSASNAGASVTATPLAVGNVNSVSLSGGSVAVNASGLGQLSLSQIYQIF